MKHDFKSSIVLMVWALVSVMAAMILVYPPEPSNAVSIPLWIVAIVLIVGMVIAGVVWLKLKKRNIPLAFSLILTFGFSSILSKGATTTESLIIAIVSILIGLGYFNISKLLAEFDQENTPQILLAANSAIIGLFAGIVGIMISGLFGIYTFALALVFGLFDVFFVSKGHMVDLTKKFMGANVIPAVVVRNAKGRFAILGAGDVMLISAMVSAATMVSSTLAIYVLSGSIAGLFALLMLSKPEKFYPAVPYISALPIIFVIGWVIAGGIL